MISPRFDSAKVLTVGDAMIDRYWHGDAKRISAEAPIPVVEVKEIEDRRGGAANVALNVSTLGAESYLVAATGSDIAARELKDKLMRSLAESENIRKRALKDRQDTEIYAVSKMSRDILSVYDNLQRALEAIPNDKSQLTEPIKNLIIGLSLIHI